MFVLVCVNNTASCRMVMTMCACVVGRKEV